MMFQYTTINKNDDDTYKVTHIFTDSMDYEIFLDGNTLFTLEIIGGENSDKKDN